MQAWGTDRLGTPNEKTWGTDCLLKETGNRLSTFASTRREGLGHSGPPRRIARECVGGHVPLVERSELVAHVLRPLAFFGKQRTTRNPLKCPRPRPSCASRQIIQYRNMALRRLIQRMFPNDLLHPNHIIPPIKLIPAVSQKVPQSRNPRCSWNWALFLFKYSSSTFGYPMQA